MKTIHELVPDLRSPISTTLATATALRALARGHIAPELAAQLMAHATTLQRAAAHVERTMDALAQASGLHAEHHLSAVAPPPLIPKKAEAVLIVDDEASLRRALTRRLGRTHVVCTAASVAEATAQLSERQDIGAVLLDLNLPDGTAWDLLRWMATHRPELVRRTVGMTGAPVSPAEASRWSQVTWARKPHDMSRIAWFLDRALNSE